MKQRLYRNFEITILLAALGIWLLRWPLLQLIAWSKMMVQYSLDHGLQKGMSMTFSGNHPCALCHAASAGAEADAAIYSSPLALSILALALVAVAVGSFITRNLFTAIQNER